MVKTSDTIVHLLGYLNPKQWASAIRTADEYGGLRDGEIFDLLQEQEERYGGGIISDVVDELSDKDGNQTSLSKQVAKHFGIQSGDA